MECIATTRMDSFLRRLAGCVLAAVWLLLQCGFANAQTEQGASIRYAEIKLGEDGYVVNADIDLVLNWRLEDAIKRGVSLNFVAEFVISEPRWYWLDRRLVGRTLNFRLSYHAITRTYRLSVGTLQRSFATLEDAIADMLSIRNWHIVDADALDNGVSYHAALRFRHDLTLLPKPFQVTALSNRDWSVATDWMNWTFLAGPSR